MSTSLPKTIQFHPDHAIPAGDWIWVYESDSAGSVTKAAAKVSRLTFRAAAGIGQGPNGQAYAIATLDAQLRPLLLAQVHDNIELFLADARQAPDTAFYVTRIGYQLAGFPDAAIGPLFANAAPNCSLPQSWRKFVHPAAAP